MGTNATPKKANVLLAQSTPKFLYIADAKTGKPAPKALRNRSLPAKTLAVYAGYASARYGSTAWNNKNAAIPKKLDPMIGTIQWMSLRLLHPNQNRQMGTKKLPTIAG